MPMNPFSASFNPSASAFKPSGMVATNGNGVAHANGKENQGYANGHANGHANGNGKRT